MSISASRRTAWSSTSAIPQDEPIDRVLLPLTPFRGIVKDYFLVCDTYFKRHPHREPVAIEAIDMGRRALHNEGCGVAARAPGRAGWRSIDNTARRLFTLLCVLHIRG